MGLICVIMRVINCGRLPKECCCCLFRPPRDLDSKACVRVGDKVGCCFFLLFPFQRVLWYLYTMGCKNHALMLWFVKSIDKIWFLDGEITIVLGCKAILAYFNAPELFYLYI